MRKVLSIVLALAMVLGCFASVFAAEYTDVKADADYATAVDVLSDLGVVSGYTDGTYQPEKVVTRAEMAALIIKALGMTPAASATTNFSDVPATHWASGYVAYASSLGVIAGYTDGTFKPSKTVSYDEALTMIVSALGYTAEGLSGTWPTAYVMKAQELGITDDVDVLGSVGANRGDIAQMLYNTLGVKFVKYSKLTEEFAESTAAKNTMFKRLGAEVGTETPVTPTTIKNAKVDLSDDLGAVIVPIVNTKGEIIAVDSYKTIFVEGKYTAGKTIGSYSIKGFDVSAVVNYVNGAVGTTPAFTAAKKFVVDEENEKVVAAIQWVASSEFQVTADVKADAVKIGAVTLPTKDGKLDTTKFELVGAASVGEIKKNNIVTVYKEGNDASGAVVKVEVGTETVIGKITKVANGKATINGTAYTAPASPVFDKDYIVYLNYAGDEAVAPALYVEEEAEAETLYAVVLAAGATSSTSEFEATTVYTRRVQLVNAEGVEQTLTVNEDAHTGLLVETDLDFKGDIAKGTFVEYTLNDDGEIATMKEASLTTLAAKTVKNGMVDGKAIASNVVVFTKSLKSLDPDFAAKAKITVAASIADEDYTELQYMLNDKAQIAFIYAGPVAGAGTGDTFNGIYVGQAMVAKDTYELYFLVGTEEKTIKANAAHAANLDSSDEQVFDTYQLLTDGTFEKVATTDDFSLDGLTVTTKAAINGSTFIADEDVTKSVVLSSSVVYYMLNEKGEWEVSDEATFLTVTGGAYVEFVDTATPAKADYIYDLVFFDGADCE